MRSRDSKWQGQIRSSCRLLLWVNCASEHQWALAFHEAWQEACGIAYAPAEAAVRTTNVAMFVERCRENVAVESLGLLGDPGLEELVLEAVDRYKLTAAFLA